MSGADIYIANSQLSGMHRFFFGLFAVFCLMPIAEGAVAEETEGEQVRASIDVLASLGGQIVWSGKRFTSASIPICVSSRTGMYSLRITALASQHPNGAQDIPYVVTFLDPTGARQSRAFGGAGQVVFVGDVDEGQACNGQSNATIEVSIPEDRALASVAGDYTNEIKLEVEPR